MVFRMFLAFLIFDPNWPFCKGYRLCMGYSLCKMVDFQTCPISWIFGVFSSGFSHRTTLIFIYNDFSHVFGIFNFWPNLTTLCKGYRLCMGYSLCKMTDFQTCLISEIFDHFVKAIGFAWAIAFARWPIFKLVSFLKYLVFFRAAFLHRTILIFL